MRYNYPHLWFKLKFILCIKNSVRVRHKNCNFGKKHTFLPSKWQYLVEQQWTNAWLQIVAFCAVTKCSLVDGCCIYIQEWIIISKLHRKQIMCKMQNGYIDKLQRRRSNRTMWRGRCVYSPTWEITKQNNPFQSHKGERSIYTSESECSWLTTINIKITNTRIYVQCTMPYLVPRTYAILVTNL
jgi:hypothetical protein